MSARDSESILREVQKIAASKPFLRSERLRAFLEFIVRSWLQDTTDSLKEYRIATEVYGRPVSFDPSSDPIVRVEARRLRAKLKEYYESDGQGDYLEISLARGSYLPVIRARQNLAPPWALSSGPVLECITVEPFRGLGAQGAVGEFSASLSFEVVRALLAENVWLRTWQSGWSVENLPRHVAMDSPPLYGVLQGSVRRRGAEIRVMARLIKLSDRSVIWSNVYSRELCDEFGTRRAIAAAIASAVRDNLSLRASRNAVHR